MKSHTLIWMAVVSFLASVSMPTVAQDSVVQNLSRKHHHYRVIDVGTFGGPSSYMELPPSRVINNHGTLVGWAETNVDDPFNPDCLAFDCKNQKSFTWHDGRLTQLPSLASEAGSVAGMENDRGWVTGFSETGTLDPGLGFPQYSAVLWRNGQIKDLGTLGGASSVAGGVNNRGEVVGGASNGVPDPFPMLTSDTGLAPFPGNTQARAFLWKHGLMFNLGTLGGADSVAFYNNDRGQVVGISYVDDLPVPAIGGIPAIATFIWDQGQMKNVGGFGGHFTSPAGLTARGEVMGTSLLAGDQVTRSFVWSHGVLKDMGDLGGENVYVHTVNEEGVATGYSDIPTGTPVFGHPFLWKNGHMLDLGPLKAGFNCAAGVSVNIHEQVVGSAGCNADGSGYSFLWEKGSPIVDIASLIVPGSDLRVFHLFAINDRGEIACEGATPDEEDRACMLVPIDDEHEWWDEATAGIQTSADAVQSNPSNNSVAVSPMTKDAMLKSFLKGIGGRYHLPAPRSAPPK